LNKKKVLETYYRVLLLMIVSILHCQLCPLPSESTPSSSRDVNKCGTLLEMKRYTRGRHYTLATCMERLITTVNKYKTLFYFGFEGKREKGYQGEVPTIPTMTLLSGDNFICCSWVLLFLNRGSGGEYNDDPTAHESSEPSEPNAASITPLGLSGICSYLRL